MTQRLALIWAMGRNRVIGKDGRLPWSLPEELDYFRRTTWGKPVIMGRRTFESVGKPLPGRLNIVLSRRGFTAAGACPAPDLEAALAIAATDPADECFVVGGAEPYALALPKADRLHATTVEADVAGDVYFPAFDLRQWLLVSQVRRAADADHAYAYNIRVYDRRARPAAPSSSVGANPNNTTVSAAVEASASRSSDASR